jgi:uncharacterized RDD family membrane protein YckC
MSALEGTSVPPPGWSAHQTPVSREPPAAEVGQPQAEAAVRWRIGAAVIDNVLVYGLYLLVCLVLQWQVANLAHLLLLLVLGVVYHFALESRDGQTIGKRQYGIRVVTVDDRRATPKAVALRSVLRIIDALPFWYLSGLVSMVRTGPERRQRIGDVAAETKVVAVTGRALRSGTPGWMLPAATLCAFAISALAAIGIATAGHQPLTSSEQEQFVSGCANSGGAVVDCRCLLIRLEGDGYATLDSLRSVLARAEAERTSGEPGAALRELTADALACRH